MKKSFFIKKNRFLVNLRHFYNTYLNIVKKYFSPQITFFLGKKNVICDSAGWSCFKSRPGPKSPWILFVLIFCWILFFNSSYFLDQILWILLVLIFWKTLVLLFLMFLFFGIPKFSRLRRSKINVYPLYTPGNGQNFLACGAFFILYLKPPEYLKLFLFFKPPEFCSFLLLVEFYLLRVLIFWFKSPEFFRFLFFAEFYLLKVFIFLFKPSEFGRVFLLRGGVLIFKSPVPPRFILSRCLLHNSILARR